MPRSPAFEFEASSLLAADAEQVWRHATTPRSMNREFFPLLRMAFPAGSAAMSLDQVELGRPLARVWILAFGFIPVEYDDLTLVEIGPGFRFLERSALLTQRVWQHERVVEPLARGCRLTDRLSFVPRAPVLGRLHRRIFRAIFALRHWQLRRIFGAAAR